MTVKEQIAKKFQEKPLFNAIPSTPSMRLESGVIIGIITFSDPLPDNTEIFVFESNEAGRHGKGAAKYAADNLGAVYGIGLGFSGRTFAIPTKDKDIQSLPLEKVKEYVDVFLYNASAAQSKRPTWTFKVSRIGCGLAGFTDEQIAPLFSGAPDNCLFDEFWKTYLGDTKKYWGKF
jgi:hypothetical protein